MTTRPVRRQYLPPERYEEIRATIKELEAAWLHDPEQRLGQLLCSLAREYPSGRMSSDVIWERRDQDWIDAFRSTWGIPRAKP